MTEGEGRGVVLKRLYDLRDHSGHVTLSNFQDLDLPIETVGRYLQYLRQLNLIDGQFLRSGRDAGIAQALVKINVHGIEAIENPAKTPSQVVIDHSINVHSSQNVQITAHNIQGVTIDIEKLNAAIDGSTITIEEKVATKSLLKRLSENKLLLSLLKSWFSGTPPTT